MRSHTPDTPTRPLPPASPLAADAGLLAEITAGLAGNDDLSQLLGRFLPTIVRLAGAQAGAVRVLSGADNRLRLVSSLGLPADLCARELTVDRHCGHCGAAADAQHVVWAADLADCAGRSNNTFFARAGLRLLAVPLQHRGHTLGVYSLFFAGSAEPGPDAQALLKSVGELLGLALNNARLEQENLRVRLANERQMLAAEVHDSLAQSLVFVKMRLPLLQDAMKAHDDARAEQYCSEVRQEVSQAHASLRNILTHFRAPMDPHGLVHALGVSAENFRRSTGAELDMAIDLPALALPQDQEAQVFHIVQEALQNVARHAHASHAWVRIAADAEGELEIVIEDDGTGLPAKAAGGGSHYGMEIMAERARRLGGKLDVGARQGGGTRVRLAFRAAAAQGGA